MRTVPALLGAAHPLPSVAVSGFAVAYGVGAVGLDVGTSVLLGVAVLSGQLSVGWSNDWVDAPLDRAAGRVAKPITAGLVPRATVGVAALVALAVCVPVSLALGLLPGVLHLTAVASAWAYNLRLKATVLSVVPYAVSFALLVAAASTSAEPPRVPGVAVLVAAALLGVAAHFANTVGDTAADALTGVRGLPQRIGPRRSLTVTAGLVAVAALVLLSAEPGVLIGPVLIGPVLIGPVLIGPVLIGPVLIGPVLLGVGVLVAVSAAVLGRVRPDGRAAFPVTLLAVTFVVAGFLVSS